MATAPKKENYELILYRLDVIDKKLDSLSSQYVSREEFDVVREQGRTKITQIEYKINDLAKKGRFEKFIYSIATALIIGFISVVFNLVMSK